MAKGVTVSHRGANYEIGIGRKCYGIWPAGATDSQPVAWWPETAEGWSAAWSRFTSMEAPGSITAAKQSASLAGQALAAPLLLAAGVVFGIIGLFPSYLNGASLASQSENLVTHVIYLAAWTLAALLIAAGGKRRRAGAMLAAGVSIVTFGSLFSDTGFVMSGGSHVLGVGLVLALVGWVAAAAGAGVALAGEWGEIGRLHRPQPMQGLVPILALIAVAIGAAVTLAPAWDRFTIQGPNGSQSVTAGNVFSAPGGVAAGNVMVMVALVAVVAVAAFWRPVRLGSALLFGAAIPMAAQAISALVQISHGTTPEAFGISGSQAAQNGITASASLTGWFWVYCMFVLVLLVSCAWLTITPAMAAAHSPAPSPSPSPAPGWSTPEPWMPHPTGASAPGPAAAAPAHAVSSPAPAVLGEPETAGNPAPVAYSAETVADNDAPDVASPPAGNSATPEADVQEPPTP